MVDLSPETSFPFEPELAAKVDAYLSRMSRSLPELDDRLRARFHDLAARGVRTAEDAVELLSEKHGKDLWSSASLLLGAYGKKQIAPAIVTALHQAQSPGLQQECMSALGAIRSAVARRTLLDVLRRDNDSDNRFTAVSCLKTFNRDPKVVPALAACLASPTEAEFVRAQAARALGDVAHPDAEEPLIAALEDEAAIVRYSAADSLGGVGGHNAIGPLRRMMRRDEDVVSDDGPLKEAAATSISNIQRRIRGSSP